MITPKQAGITANKEEVEGEGKREIVNKTAPAVNRETPEKKKKSRNNHDNNSAVAFL
jgi:hypothetical protein